MESCTSELLMQFPQYDGRGRDNHSSWNWSVLAQHDKHTGFYVRMEPSTELLNQCWTLCWESQLASFCASPGISEPLWWRLFLCAFLSRKGFSEETVIAVPNSQRIKKGWQNCLVNKKGNCGIWRRQISDQGLEEEDKAGKVSVT